MSRTKTFLKVYKHNPLKQIKCNERTELNLKLRFVNRIQAGNIHFQIMGRSRIVHSGFYIMSSSQTQQTIGNGINIKSSPSGIVFFLKV